MSFQVHALDNKQFQPFFSMSDEELKANKACRWIVKSYPGTPCRVSLEDARVDEEVILVNYEHQPNDTPYQSKHAVFVRKGAETAKLSAGEIPKLLHHRLISVRAFNVEHMIVTAETVEGSSLEEVLRSMFDNKHVEYIHLHYAQPGCFAASVTRV